MERAQRIYTGRTDSRYPLIDGVYVQYPETVRYGEECVIYRIRTGEGGDIPGRVGRSLLIARQGTKDAVESAWYSINNIHINMGMDDPALDRALTDIANGLRETLERTHRITPGTPQSQPVARIRLERRVAA